jgi:hypothetical protein
VVAAGVERAGNRVAYFAGRAGNERSHWPDPRAEGTISAVPVVATSLRAERQRRARRNARLVGLAGFLAAAALPIVLWHDAIGLMASGFRFDAPILAGWLGYGLIAAALAFFVPVLVSIGRKPNDRLYPRSRNALMGWGISCYVLGMALAVQVGTIARGLSGH